MFRLIVIALLACCFFAVAPSAEAGPVARVITAPLRVGAAALRGVNRVRVNRLERRASRGNRLAAARVESTHARMHSRCR